jgi:serine/threonine protein kinase
MNHPDKNTLDDESGLGADGIPVLKTPVQYDSTGTSVPGTVIGDYRLIREIGRGATAAVLLCENIHSGREYALKRLREGAVTDWHRKMLENEARLSGRLEHKNIASIYTADPDQGYIVMEYVDGNSLDEFSSKETLLPVDIVVRVIKEVAEALNYSSRMNILHLDIKPGNIIVSRDFSRVKVMDFGCASIDGKRDDMLLIAGSVNYMAPEQLIEGGKIDARADIYSLGAVFYRLITGCVTYRTKHELSLPNVIRLITSKPHIPVFAYRHDVDDDLVAVIDKMLDKNAERRYASWVDVILDLAKLSADLAKSFVEPTRVSAEPAKRPAYVEQSMIDLILECPLFKGLVESDLYELILNSGLRKLARFEMLTSEGESGDFFYVILQGGINITKRGDMLREFHSGEIIGEEVCFAENSNKYCFSARVVQDASVLGIQKSMRHRLGNAVRDRLNEALLKSMNIKLFQLDEYGNKGR